MNANKIVISVVVFLCGILFWPTLHRYEIVWEERIVTEKGVNESEQRVYRINRLTGHSERIIPPSPGK